MGTDIIIYLGGLALLDTLSPTIIGVTLFLVLTYNKNLVSSLLVYLFTVVILYFSLGITMMLGMNYITEVFSNVFRSEVFSWGIFLIGVILFTASFFIPQNKGRAIPKPTTQNLYSIIIIGVITFIIEAGTALPYFAAIGLLSTMNMPFYQWMPILAIYNIIMILPALLIISVYTLLGELIKPTLINFRNRISSGSSSTLSWIMCIVGVILIIYTIDYL